MFFFEDEEKRVIEFKVDLKRLADFELALSILGKTRDQAFEDFLSLLITKALKKAKGEEEPEEEPGDSSDIRRLSEKTIRGRIYKWARKENTFPHLMVKVFIESSLYLDEEYAYRAKMEARFNDLTNASPSDKRFITVFRQMCSDSFRAYGNIFIYDNARENVYLNEKYKDLILELKEDFLR